MDEQKNQQNQQTANVNVPDYTNEINAMYDAQRQQQLQSLENAYNQNTQTLQSARANIAPTYNKQANDLNAQYERSRMNNNMQAAANGINTGVGSQMALAQQSNYLDAFGNIRSQQARAEQDLDQQLANLEINYKNSVAQALANNDHERAAALMAEYKRRDEAAKEQQRYNDNWNLNKAQTLAQYGNFSGYAELYGQDVANAMQQYYDMMNGGGSGSSGRGGGYGGSGGGGNNNGGNGPGTYPPEGDGGGGENYEEWLLRRSKYGSDEQFYLAEMNRINQEAMGEARELAKKNGMKEGSPEWQRFVDMYAANARETNADYIASKNLYESNRNGRWADEEAKRQQYWSEYDKSINTKPGIVTPYKQTKGRVSDLEANRRRLIEENEKQMKAH